MAPDLLPGLVIGLAGGLASGLTGTSPGGALVALSSLLLGADQHVAQGVSLIAQVPPTAVTGIARYRAGGATSPARWVVQIMIGFVLGGGAGALAAGAVSGPALRWTYVAYLAILLVLLILRGGRATVATAKRETAADPGVASLLAIGAVAGFSAGFLGIGGGLAITVGLTALLHVGQHRAQLISLVLSLAPVNLPAAWVYYSHGWTASWPALAGVICGLAVGGDLGARIATRLSATRLRHITLALISAMTALMAWKALG